MRRGWVRGWAIVGLAAAVAGPAAAQEPRTGSDQLIEQLATGLARLAEAASPRPVAYFTAEPTPQVRAYLEGQGIEVVVTGGPATAAVGAPAPAPPAVIAAPPASAPPYGMMGMRVPESQKLIQEYLAGVRQLAASLPPDSPLTIDAFTVDLPGGSVLFRLR